LAAITGFGGDHGVEGNIAGNAVDVGVRVIKLLDEILSDFGNTGQAVYLRKQGAYFHDKSLNRRLELSR